MPQRPAVKPVPGCGGASVRTDGCLAPNAAAPNLAAARRLEGLPPPGGPRLQRPAVAGTPAARRRPSLTGSDPRVRWVAGVGRKGLGRRGAGPRMESWEALQSSQAAARAATWPGRSDRARAGAAAAGGGLRWSGKPAGHRPGPSGGRRRLQGPAAAELARELAAGRPAG